MEWFDKIMKHGWVLVVLSLLATAGFWIFIVWCIVKLLQHFGVI